MQFPATVYVPARDIDSVSESGYLASEAEGVEFRELRDGKAAFRVESGTYEFVASM